jgi:hypothetical protein
MKVLKIKETSFGLFVDWKHADFVDFLFSFWIELVDNSDDRSAISKIKLRGSKINSANYLRRKVLSRQRYPFFSS